MTDHVFHNISWEAAGVAVGEAMKRYNAHVAWIASDKTRFDQYVKKSGGLLRKKVTTYVDGYVKPQWFVAMPLGHQPQGGMSAICVTSTGAVDKYGSTHECDAPEHVAISGVSIQQWEGGNMPEIEEKVYAYQQSKSSFTVLAFTILTFAFTWGLMAAFSSVIGSTAGAIGAGGLSPLAGASIGAGIYAGVAGLSGAGLTSAQSSWAGSTGDGVLKIDSGSFDQHQTNLNKAVENKQIKSRVGTGLAGAKSLYSGNCDENLTIAQCQASGKDAGTMHRPDIYREVNTPLMLVAQKEKCEAQVTTQQRIDAQNNEVYKEYLRKWVQQCTAPQSGTWDIGGN